MSELKTRRINKHISLNKKNFVFLSEVKTDLLVLMGHNTNYTKLINLAIDHFNKTLCNMEADEGERIKKLYEIIREFENNEMGGQL